MNKSELDVLNNALSLLDRESNRYDIYRDEVEVFEAATSILLAAIRHASVSVSEGSAAKGGWYNRWYSFWHALRLVFS